jgi:LPS export ABC transporter permease LptG/LPS export ABC transporter permease LptF
MRIFTRYILREVISHGLLGGALFTFVLFMRDLGKILELVVRDSASAGDVARIFAYTLPNVLIVTIPMAVLVGILLGLSRLASDSEITAMRASGMGALDFVGIVAIVSALALALGLFNSLYLAPRSAAALLSLEDSLKSSQASFEVEPRVFYEDFKNYVLYIQDVRPAAGASLWHHVFLADLTQPATPHITTADQAVVVSGSDATGDAQTIRLHLINGGQHQTSSSDPNQYNISTFNTTDLPIETGAQEDPHLGHADTPILALPLAELWRLGSAPGNDIPGHPARIYRIEFNKRFSYPFACLVLMLVGVPLGLSSKRGGKSTGFVLTILLVFVYYFLSSVGVAFARNGKLSPFLGVWGANLIFAAAGALLLYQMSRGGIALSLVSSIGVRINRLLARFSRKKNNHSPQTNLDIATILRRFRSTTRMQFPLLLDDYVMREYATNFGLVLSAFSILFIIFTFFELIGDIIRNRTPLVTVGDYLINLIPFIVYQVTPLCALVAVLITFGSLSKTSEITAMKATGTSLYRIVTPVLITTLLISIGLFAFDEFYLPAANRRQEALRSVIKDKPARTFLRPDRNWISGQTNNAGDPARIFYYQYFDANKNAFANLTVFEFEPNSFILRRRIFAASTHWDDQTNRWIFENGWERTFSGDTIASYHPFTVTTFNEIHEQPAYFKKEDRPSQEMSYNELSAYIADLKQSGFDTKRLSVQLNKKIAYPLITLVMAILAIPFSLSMGKRGSLAGIAIAIGLAIAYQVIAGLFEAMGNVNTLPAMLAAWTPDLLFALAGTYLLLRAPS